MAGVTIVRPTLVREGGPVSQTEAIAKAAGIYKRRKPTVDVAAGIYKGRKARWT